MITTPTLFILGAGASMPYGFPDSRTLFDDICAGAFDVPAEHDDDPPGFAGSRANEKRDFCTALAGCGLTSVDRFLEFRGDLLQVGKAAIAGRLVKYERPHELFRAPRQVDWYRTLFTAMVAPLDRFHKNQVAFATFNYDRSLEHFLSTALSNLNKCDLESARAEVSHLRIEHLYGSLGEYFDGTSDLYRPYQVDEQSESLRRAARSIRISTHEQFVNGHFEVLDDLYGWAERVVILGLNFTFEENVRRLGLDRFRGDANVLASCMDMQERERLSAREVSQRYIVWADPDDDCMLTLRKHVL